MRSFFHHFLILVSLALLSVCFSGVASARPFFSNSCGNCHVNSGGQINVSPSNVIEIIPSETVEITFNVVSMPDVPGAIALEGLDSAGMGATVGGVWTDYGSYYASDYINSTGPYTLELTIDAGATLGDYPIAVTLAGSGAWSTMTDFTVRLIPPPPIYVDAAASGTNNGRSWTTAYKYLQDALTVVFADQEIWVAEGTYKPDTSSIAPFGSGDRYATFGLVSGVRMYGGFRSGGGTWEQRNPEAFNTVLSGNIGAKGGDYDNSYHVVTGNGTSSETVLDGFTIVGGNADGAVPHNRGGGIYNDNGRLRVVDCLVVGNEAELVGGGMYNIDGAPTISKCEFIGNLAGSSAAMHNESTSNTTITNCAFIGNAAENVGGAIGNAMCTTVATNCVFSGNTAGSGGALFNVTSEVALTNCSFAGNKAKDGGAAFACDSQDAPSRVELVNCILWNGGTEVLNSDTSRIAINYSDVRGGWGGGTGNISVDPLFKDAAGVDGIVGTEDDNLELASGSECIDAGDNGAVPADNTDLDGDGDVIEQTPVDIAGNMRFTDDPVVPDSGAGALPIVEMGAYERYEFCGSGAYPNPPMDVTGRYGVPDCRVDFFDFSVFSSYWLEYTGPE
jgi:hypothetical protein